MNIRKIIDPCENEYGTVGDMSNIECKDGTFMQVGDVVVVSGGAIADCMAFVSKDEKDYFIMGFAGDSYGGNLAQGLSIEPIRKYWEVEVGETVGSVCIGEFEVVEETTFELEDGDEFVFLTSLKEITHRAIVKSSCVLVFWLKEDGNNINGYREYTKEDVEKMLNDEAWVIV